MTRRRTPLDVGSPVRELSLDHGFPGDIQSRLVTRAGDTSRQLPVSIAGPPEFGLDALTHGEATLQRLHPLVGPDDSLRESLHPDSVLLTGPRGNGKSRIAHAIAGELELPLVTLRPGNAIRSDDDSVLDPGLIEDIEEYAPCVVVIQHLEAFAPNGGFGGSSQRIRSIDVLHSVLSGLRQSNIVVGTATRLDEIHDLVRNADWFDIYCPIGNPDAQRRARILDELFEAVELPMDVGAGEQEQLAERMDGLAATDIETILRRAIGRYHQLSDTDPVIDLEMLEAELNRFLADTRADRETGSDLFDGADADSCYRYRDHRVAEKADGPVEMSWTLNGDDDNEDGEATIASAIQQDIEVPDIGYSDVGGLDHAKRALREAIEWPRRYPDLCEELAIDTSRGILLHGPPGNGKTMLAKAIANETDSRFIAVKGPEVMDRFVGESQRLIGDLFATARELAPAVIFIDEIDAITDERGVDSVTDEVVNQLLLEMDGLEKLSDIVVVGATNRPDIIDDALRRPGRFGTEIHIPKPDADARQEIFQVHIHDRPVADDVTARWLADRSNQGVSGADIAAVCERAARNAARRNVASSGEAPAINGSTIPEISIERRDFELAFAEIQNEDGINRSPGFQ